MRYRWPVIACQALFLLSWLIAGCSPAPAAKAGSKALADTPSAVVGQTKGGTARTPSPTRYYDVPLPPATATAKPQSPVPTAPAGSSSGGIKLTILHTNDSRGYVDPCG